MLGFEHNRGIRRTHGLCFRLLIDRAADHKTDDLGDFCRRGIERGDILTVAHNGDAVGDALEFIHAVRDIDDADTGLFQLSNEDEQIVDLRVGQDSRRLIKNQQSCVLMRQSLCNFNHLLLCDRQRLDDGFRVKIQMQLVEQFLRHGVLLRLVHEQALHGFTPNVNVFRHSQVLHEVQFLMDDADAERLRIARAMNLDMLSKKFNRTAIARIDAGQHLHKRRFTGAVFADQRHDLALTNLQLRVVQRMDAREVLLDTGHSENCFGHLSFTFPFLLRRVFLFIENETFCSCSTQIRFRAGWSLPYLKSQARGCALLPPRATLLPYSLHYSRPAQEQA